MNWQSESERGVRSDEGHSSAAAYAENAAAPEGGAPPAADGGGDPGAPDKAPGRPTPLPIVSGLDAAPLRNLGTGLSAALARAKRDIAWSVEAREPSAPEPNQKSAARPKSGRLSASERKSAQREEAARHKQGAARAADAQLLLDLGARPGRRAPRFLVSEANETAIALAGDPASWPNGLAVLVGPPGCGKSEIARALHPDATALTAEHCRDGLPPADLIRPEATILFDDMDQAFDAENGGAFEMAAFHLLNLLQQRGARLLATGRQAPSNWPVLLPDLRSRLAAAALASISPPDDALLTELLIKLFDDRGVTLEPAVARFLVPRMERSFSEAHRIVETLDRASLRRKRSVTTSLAAEALGWRPARY